MPRAPLHLPEWSRRSEWPWDAEFPMIWRGGTERERERHETQRIRTDARRDIGEQVSVFFLENNDKERTLQIIIIRRRRITMHR